MRQAVGVAVFFGMIGVDPVRPDLHADLLHRGPWSGRPLGARKKPASTG